MRLRTNLLLCVVSLVALSCSTMAPRGTGFLDRSIEVGKTSYPYVVYVPRAYDPSRSWPVILFLHGSGERGTDGLRPTQVGIGGAIRSDATRIPAIVVFPQVPPDRNWLGDPGEAAMAALERTIRAFHGDRDRVYLAGLSMGGYGVYHLALAHPKKFAALVVVCGGLVPHPTTTSVARSPLAKGGDDPWAYTAHALRHLPIWIVHGGADPIIPVDEARRMAEDLRKEGADVHYAEYPGVGHDSWDRAFEDPDLWAWLFAERRGR